VNARFRYVIVVFGGVGYYPGDSRFPRWALFVRCSTTFITLALLIDIGDVVVFIIIVCVCVCVCVCNVCVCVCVCVYLVCVCVVATPLLPFIAHFRHAALHL
jgi:hypothetical protein